MTCLLWDPVPSIRKDPHSGAQDKPWRAPYSWDLIPGLLAMHCRPAREGENFCPCSCLVNALPSLAICQKPERTTWVPPNSSTWG